jgi:DNA gyrase subunit A
MARRPNKSALKKTRAANKKTDTENISSIVGDTTLPVTSFKDMMESNMREYGLYVVEQRAIPCIHDGMKPVHRRVLWSAYKMGARSNGKTVKTARLVGNTMGLYHPHGDAAIADTVSGMIEGTTCPLLHGQGNFGSYTSAAPAAAMRYTECRLNSFAEQCLLDPYYLNVTHMIPNYDSSEKEPVSLPAMLPMALLTGAYGIALATTTNMPCYSLESVKKVVLMLLKGEDDPKKFSKTLELVAPYGGYPISSDKEKYALFYRQGSPRIDWKNVYSITGEDTLEITGMHPEWNFDSKVAAIDRMPFVQSVQDISSQDGIRIRIQVKKNTSDSDWDKLKKLMEGAITYRCNVIRRKFVDDEFPEVVGNFESTTPYAILKSWLKWRLNLEKRALKFELEAIQTQLKKENLMLLACRSRDVIFAILKMKNIDKVEKLSKALDISLEDAKHVWGIAVGRLDTISEDDQKRKISELKARCVQIKVDFKNPEVPVYNRLKTMSY